MGSSRISRSDQRNSIPASHRATTSINTCACMQECVTQPREGRKQGKTIHSKQSVVYRGRRRRGGGEKGEAREGRERGSGKERGEERIREGEREGRGGERREG